MAAIKDFTIPSFLQNQDADTIQERMFDVLPDDMDKAEAGYPWDFTHPTALEKARMAEQDMLLAIRAIFPMWATGNILDYHAENKGMERKAAVFAKVTVTITGTKGTLIETGTKFSTEATPNTPAIEFQTESDITIPDTGTVNVVLTAVIAGSSGNVTAGTITLQSAPQSGITGITNPAAATGGIDEETDDALRLRIVEFDQSQGVSFVGSPSDYKRWAESVTGVGVANVIEPETGTDPIRIYLIDSNGNPATTNLCTAVYNYIMRPDNPKLRLAEVNAMLSVLPPATLSVTVAATITRTSSYTLASVKSSFLTALIGYLKTCTEAVLYNKVGSLLMATEGVSDYADLKLNGVTSNASLSSGTMAVTDVDKVVLTSA